MAAAMRAWLATCPPNTLPGAPLDREGLRPRNKCSSICSRSRSSSRESMGSPTALLQRVESGIGDIKVTPPNTDLQVRLVGAVVVGTAGDDQAVPARQRAQALAFLR